MTEDDYDDWDDDEPDYDDDWEDYREPDDEPDYDDDWEDYREPEPTEEQISEYERDRYLRSLSPIRRLVQPVRDLWWSRTWRLRMKARARWLVLTGRAETGWDDEPPF